MRSVVSPIRISAEHVSTSPSVADGGGGGYDGGMEERVKKLEELGEKTVERLNVIEQDLATIKSNYATKADIHESANSMIKWIVATAAMLGVAGITIMTFVLNNAIPKKDPPPIATPAPIVIYAQPAPVAAPVAPPAPAKQK